MQIIPSASPISIDVGLEKEIVRYLEKEHNQFKSALLITKNLFHICTRLKKVAIAVI